MYQLDSSANLVNVPQIWAKWAELAVLFESKMAPRILIFSAAMGYSFDVKNIFQA